MQVFGYTTATVVLGFRYKPCDSSAILSISLFILSAFIIRETGVILEKYHQAILVSWKQGAFVSVSRQQQEGYK